MQSPAVEAAERRGLDIAIVPRPKTASLAEAAAGLGIAEHQIVKTLVVKKHDGGFLFALIPGGSVISWPKLRAVVGVNKLRLPDAEVALEATGYARGTIVPIGSITDWPVYADESLRGAGRIAMGAGIPDHSLFVDADALLNAYDATVADISKPE